MNTSTLASTQSTAHFESLIKVERSSIIKLIGVVLLLVLASINLVASLAALFVAIAVLEVSSVWRDISFDDDKYTVSLEDIIRDLEC